jgi:hypothetical protein
MQTAKRLLTAALSILLLFTFTPLASAQNAPSGSGLSISPTISEFTIKPGGSGNLNITLKNITVDNVIAKGSVDDFTSDNLTGTPRILTNSTTPTPNSIKKFVTNIDNIPLAKGQQKNVILGLDIPKNTPPGAYYGVVRYRAIPANLAAPGPGQVALTASVGTIVLITVPGNLREQVQVNGIHVYRGGHDGTIFFGSPSSIGIDIKNFGNGFVKPFGTVEVHDTFNKTITTYQFNNPKQPGNILPNSRRIFTQNIKGAGKPGRYSIIASVSYGNGSQVLTLQKDFWVIPIWLAVVILLVLAGLVFLTYRAYRRYNRQKRHSHQK